MSAKRIKRSARPGRPPLKTAWNPSVRFTGSFENDEGILANRHDVGNCFVLDQPQLIEEIERHGLSVETMPHDASELYLSILGWDKVPDVEGRSKRLLEDLGYGIGSDLDVGKALAELGRQGLMLMVASHDRSKLILQINRKRTVQ